MDIRVPNIADGIEGGAVISILVAEGEEVTEGQDLIELETEKATAAVPSTAAGKVTKIHVAQGDEVKVGQVLISIESKGGAPIPQAKTASAVEPAPMPQAAPALRPAAPVIAADPTLVEAGLDLAASPTVRHMARQLGIDLRQVRGSARGGRILADDLQGFIAGLQQTVQQPQGAPGVPAPKPLPDFSKWGSVKIEKMSMLRKKIAEKMTESWTTVPHVTQYDEANITPLTAIYKKHKPAYEKKGAKLSLTVLILRSVVNILKKHPNFNASIDTANGRIIYKDYVNLGIAVDTDQGLIVPVIRNADKKSALDLANELKNLAERTRARKISIDEMQGGTFTISNQGGIGGGPFTPIINVPEVAILGLAKGVKKPVVYGDKVEIGIMLPLSVSYDHRLIDGGSAARFISDLVSELENFDENQLKL